MSIKELQLDGKVVVVTGAFGSLGMAIVKAALAAGAKVAALDSAESPTNENALAGATLYGGVDISDTNAAKVALARVNADLGDLYALVNVAGSFRWELVETGKLDTWDFLYRVNVRTAVSASQAAIPLIKKGPDGRIVNIGAAGAVKAATGMGAYAASKAGVAKLTEALAEELKENGITVNALLPSIIDTAPNRAEMPDADFSRWVKTSQLAEIIVFLLSPTAQSITGALIPVTGRV